MTWARIVALCFLVLAAASPGARAATTELHLEPGTDTSSQKTFTYKGKTKYTITVTGTVTSNYAGTTCVYDFAYEQCNSSPPVRNGSGIGTRGNDTWAMGEGGQGFSDFANPYPAFREDHSYTFTYARDSFDDAEFIFWAKPSGMPYMTTAYTGSFDVKLVSPDKPTGCSAAAGTSEIAARAAACLPPGDTATVATLVGEVILRRANGKTEPLTKGTKLRKGDSIVTGIESEAVLKFPDRTTLLVKEMSELQISDVESADQRQRIRVSLKIGEVAAEINPQKTFQSDFKISLPGSAASDRGTKFSAFYDPTAKVSLYSVKEGTVEVNAGSRKLMLGKGREVQVVRGKIGRPTGLGKAGARGGVNRATATRRVLARIGKSRCKVSPARSKALGTAHARGGWRVTVKLTGAVKGKSKWTVKGRKVKPTNAKAKKIAKGCA